MELIFNYKSNINVTDKELKLIWKQLNKKFVIVCRIWAICVLVLMMIYLPLFIKDKNMYFIGYSFMLVVYLLISMQLGAIYRKKIIKKPIYIFEEECFYIGKTKYDYSNILLLEEGHNYAAITIGKNKEIIIFGLEHNEYKEKLLMLLREGAKEKRIY